MIPKAEWYWASNIYRNVYKFEWRKRRKNFLLHHLVRISLLDDAFLKILERTGNWQKQEKKEKRKKAEKCKEIKFNFWACMKYWWTKSYIGRDTSGTTIDCVSTECRLTIVRVSTNYRPTINCYIDHYINQVLTNYRPLYWPTDRSTLPTVNMICFSLQL